MVDVFISYSRTNQEVVQRLAAAVAAEGYRVWWDADLPPHRSYGEVITEQISTARAAIVVWSRDAAQSEWVRAEADVARGQKKLIQTSIDDQMPPMPFNQIQFASIGDWNGEPDHPGWRKVKASLAILCGAAQGEGAVEMPSQPRPHAPRPPAQPVTPPSVAAPARGGSSHVVAWTLVAVLLVVVIGGGAWLLLRDNGQAPAERTIARAGEAGDEPDPPVGTARARTPPAKPAAPSFDPAPAPAPARVPAAAGSGLIFPDSDRRRLTPADLAGLSRQQLRIARNEIYARRGRIFRDPALRAHFSQFSWYQPVAAEVRLSPVEGANVRLLQMAENGR